MIAVGLMVLIAMIGLAWWRQERITYQPPPPPFDSAGDTPRVEYSAADGARLFAYVVGKPAPDAGLIIAFHGNADLAVWQIPWAEELARRSGWQVMLAEYRGYGGAEGSPSYASTQLDARAALAHAVDQMGFSTAQMVFFGHSLGSAVATELAVESPPAALVLQSPFTSAKDMARIIVAQPIAMAWRLISRVHYDTESRLATLDVPVSVAHGTRDLIVPLRMGRRVHASAKVKGQLLIVEGAGHNDVEDRGGERYWSWLVSALTGVSAVR